MLKRLSLLFLLMFVPAMLVSCTMNDIQVKFQPEFGKTPNIEWVKVFNSKPNTTFLAYALQQTKDEGYIITGISSSSSSVYNITLIKTDAKGNKLWEKTLINTFYPIQFEQTKDDGYMITGYQDGLDNLVKTDTEGLIQWAKSSIGHKFLQTTDGEYIVFGNQVTKYGATYLTKFDTKGNILWESCIEKSNYNKHCFSLRQDIDKGYVAMVGFSESNKYTVKAIKVDSKGNKVWEKEQFTLSNPPFNPEYLRIYPSNDEGYIFFDVDVFDVDVFDVEEVEHVRLTKVDASGNILWTKLCDGIEGNIKCTSDGTFLLFNQIDIIDNSKSSSSYDVNIIEINAFGDYLWQARLTGSGISYASCIEQTKDGGYVIIGGRSVSNKNSDILNNSIYLLKFRNK